VSARRHPDSRGTPAEGGCSWRYAARAEAGVARGHAVKDLTTILEAIADIVPTSKEMGVVREAVRGAPGRAISGQYLNEQGELPAILTAPSLVERLFGSSPEDRVVAGSVLNPSDARGRAWSILGILETSMAQPVLLRTPAQRPQTWLLLVRLPPHPAVLSHNEVPPQARVASLAVLD
jgi:flagellar biosynthesis component FlhA